MDIFDIFAAASFEYAVYSNLAATDLARERVQQERQYFIVSFLTETTQ